MIKKNYRWGILGAGKIAEKFCTALKFTPGAEVYAIASRDAAKVRQYADKYGAAKCFTSYQELIGDSLVDIIYIATPHAFHYEHTMACLHGGKGVLCEKPMSLSYLHTKEMTDTATEKKLFLMEGLWTLCMPFISKIKEIIATGTIGTPQHLAADFGFTAPLELESRLFKKSLGGGSMMDVGIYPLSLATLLFGEPSNIQTAAKLGSTGVDYYTNALLTYQGGFTAQLLSSISFNTAIEATIIGSMGRIKISNPWFKATDFAVILNDGTTETYNIPHQSNGFEHEIMEVMHCLEDGLLQSNKVPHSLSLSVSSSMDKILMQAGVNYQQ